MVSGALDIVKANDRYILRHTQMMVPKRADRPNRRYIIERNKGRERLPGRQQLMHHRVAQLRRRKILLKLNDQLRMHFQPQCVDTDVVRGDVSDTVTNERFRDFWRSLLEQKRRGRPIVSSTPYLEFLSRWEDFSISAYSAPGARCAAGHGFLYVDPHGKAYPCVYVKGKTQGVDLLTNGWREAWDRKTPCNTCSVGPMLEFNLLFQRPLAAAVESVHAYA